MVMQKRRQMLIASAYAAASLSITPDLRVLHLLDYINPHDTDESSHVIRYVTVFQWTMFAVMLATITLSLLSFAMGWVIVAFSAAIATAVLLVGLPAWGTSILNRSQRSTTH